MNLLATSDFASHLNDVFAYWAIALFVFFAILILLAFLFKGPKIAVILLIISAVTAGGFVLAAFISMVATWDTLRIIDFAIKWGPTILFVGVVVISTLVNAKRGLRKSLILLLHAVIACIICVIFYYVCVSSAKVDKTILTAINGAMGGNTLQNKLGVSEECTTIRAVLTEYLPKLLGGDLQALLEANPQYAATIADMAFRIAFTFVSLVLYFLLVFVLYIIYLVAYPERRHKKKVNLAVTNNDAPRTYVKRHIGGGVVGFVRGIVVGLLSLSFLGSAFFMVAGGKGNGTLGDYDFGNDDYNYYYSIYRSIESYGSHGIFKILNSMTDSTDTPFYLFPADMVLSGSFDDEENGINDKNINFREELAAFTGFAKDTLNLLMKYGEEDIVAIINGKGGDGAFDTIVNIMSIPEFRAEFDLLIEEFDSQTYIINLGMSLVNYIVDNIDDVSFTSSISADNRELIKILFKKGHLSDYIPDELILKRAIEAGIIKPSDKLIRPRLKVSHLLNKKDVRLILQMAFSFLSGEQQTNDAINMVRTLLPEVRQLSILQTSRANELDPVLSRIYCYIENKYLAAEGESGITYKSVADKNIKWLNEINILLDVAEDSLTLWENIRGYNKSALDTALWLLDADNPDYAENARCFDNIRSALEKSDIIGTVMSTSYVYDLLRQALAAVFKHIYVPEDLIYNRKENADGSVIMGEIYYVFGGFKLLTSPENRELINKILELVDGKEVDTFDMLGVLSNAFKSTDSDGNTLSSYFTESYILRSLLSTVMIEYGAGYLYVPNATLDKLKNGATVNMINKAELQQFLDNLSEFTDFVKPIVDSDDEERITYIAEVLQNDNFISLIDKSRIYEGTIAYYLASFLNDSELIVMPRHLIEEGDGWVTTVLPNGSKKNGELKNLLAALKLADVDLAEIANGEFDANTLFDKLVSFGTEEAEEFLSSEILHYNISKYLIDGFETDGFGIIVPNGARTKTPQGDSIEYVVKKSEIIKLFTAVSRLELSGETDISLLLTRLVVNKEVWESGLIMSASIAYTIANNNGITDMITIPESYLAAGGKSALEDYNSSNIWKAELPRFIDAIDEILGISQKGEGFVFDDESLQESFSNLITGLNGRSNVKAGLTKLQLCYLSDIVRSEMTVRIDEKLLDVGLVTREVLSEAKSHGYYKRDELESLSKALEFFEIDLLNMDSSEIISKVTERALKLNEPFPDGGGKTALEVIYVSHIISYVISNEIDKALDGAIETQVANYLKDGRSSYPLQEIAALINAVNEIGVTDFGDLADFTLSTIGDLNGPAIHDPAQTRLAYIYFSRIVGGVITKGVYDSLNSGEISDTVIDHSKAYEEDVRIYRLEEIESIIYVLGDLENIDINEADLGKISECLYNENGVTKSYLLAAAASEIFKNSNNFIIPVDVLDEESCVLPRESALVIDVFLDIYKDKGFDEIEEWEITEIPRGETRTKMISSEIMRATLTDLLAYENFDKNKEVYVSRKHVKSVLDISGEVRRIISEAEFAALTDALDALYGDTARDVFEIPTFRLDEIVNYNETTLEKILQSDILLHRLSESLLGYALFRNYISDDDILKQTAIELYTGKLSEREVVSGEAISEFCKNYP